MAGSAALAISGAAAFVKLVQESKFTVTCGIEVTNGTNYSLTHPDVYINGGEVSIPPTEIWPGLSKIMVCHNSRILPDSSYGTVSWKIEEKNRWVVIMWSAPYNLTLYSNTMSVGITTLNDNKPSKPLFDQMYDTSTDSRWFRRRKYNKTINTVAYSDGEFEIRGTMSTTNKAVASLILKPVRTDNVVKNCKQQRQRRLSVRNHANELLSSDEDEEYSFAKDTTPC